MKYNSDGKSLYSPVFIGFHYVFISFHSVKFYKVNKKMKNIRCNDFLRYLVLIFMMLYCYYLKEFLQNILYKQI